VMMRNMETTPVVADALSWRLPRGLACCR